MNCYVCGGDIKDVPLEERLRARRSKNVPVILSEPCEKYPEGLGRHSYCVPGGERWFTHTPARSKRDKWWRMIFTPSVAEDRPKEVPHEVTEDM